MFFKSKRLIKLITLAGATLPLFSAVAAGPSVPLYFWDNQEGLVPANHCTTEAAEETQFRVSQYYGNKAADTENLRNYGGVQQSHLINGSLVKIVDGRKKSHYEYIEVVGVNQDENVNKTRWFSERLDKGYLFDRSIEPVEDYVFEIADQGQLGKFPNLEGQSISGTYWKVLSDQHYLKLNCENTQKDRDYLVFHVYDKTKTDGPIARVGVFWDETKIFSQIKTIKTTDALAFLPTLRTDEKLDEIMSETAEIEDIDEDSGDTITKSLVDRETQLNVSDADMIVESSQKKLTDELLNKDLDEETKLLSEEGGEADTEVFAEDLDALDSQVDTIQGISNVVCIANETLNVRDDSLNEVVFKAKRSESVKVFQGWGENEKESVIGGKTYRFVRVEFPEREESDQVVGWVAEEFVKTKEECPYTNGSKPVRNEDTKISGIDDPMCCEFPTVKKVTHSFTSGMRRFNAGRSSGKRLHAACDLYRYKDEPIMSIAPGEVVRDRYYFYQGTYALEVKHSGGFIVRYGEITGKGVSGVSKGKSVKMGQRLGYIGVVNSGCCRPMLHFELYSGKRNGALSQKGNRYQRRGDLMDPTPYLLRWQSEKF